MDVYPRRPSTTSYHIAIVNFYRVHVYLQVFQKIGEAPKFTV